MTHTVKIRSMALAVIDVQSKYTKPKTKFLDVFAERLPIMNDAIRMFSEMGRPVIYVYYDSTDPEAEDGPYEGLYMCGSPLEVHKHKMNAFSEADMSRILKEQGCDTVAFVGLATQYCVLTSYLGAMDEGFTPIMIKGGTAAMERFNIDAVEKIYRTWDIDRIRQHLVRFKETGEPTEVAWLPGTD